MFQNAANKYFNWFCSVGGGSPSIKGKSHGMGCTLDAKHILTAYHCWSSIKHQYEWPVVLKSDGVFRCEVIFKSSDSDIAVLRAIERIDDRSIGSYKDYPKFTDIPLFLGASVGFMSSLTLYDSLEESNTYTHLSTGTISFFLRSNNTKAPQFAISSTVIQKGCSGSAVFRPDGRIVGVIVQTLSFGVDLFDPNSPRHVLPVVTSISPFIDDINTILVKS